MDLNVSSILSCCLASLDCSDVIRLKVAADSAIDVSVNDRSITIVVINTALLFDAFLCWFASLFLLHFDRCLLFAGSRNMG